MSYRHGRGARNAYGSYRQRESSEDTHDGSSHNAGNRQSRGSAQGSRGRGRGGHPPWLKGKEIGLYYKKKSQSSQRPTHAIKLNPHIERKIKNLLESMPSTNFRPVSGTGMYDGIDSKLKARYDHINDSHFKKNFLEIVSGDIQQNLTKSMLAKSKLVQNDTYDKRAIEEHKERVASPGYQKMLKFREKLPAFKMRRQVLELIEKNQVVVISGETGCGKTTQVAQFILDDQIERGNGSVTKIICTQPRRISAISVAERVAAERAERLGCSVGFQIRLEKELCRDYASILFCTTGMLLQFLHSNPALTDWSHLILDEIHERSTESDFIITLLKQIIPRRPNLKVILMSATLNSDQFSKYYNNCPNIHIPGFTYPVQEYYLEDVLQFTRFKFPPPPEMPNNHRKHMKRYKNQQKKSDDFLDFIQPYLRHIESERKYPQFVIDQLRNPVSEDLSLELIAELVHFICTNEGPGAILIFLPGMTDITKLTRMLLESGEYPSSRFIVYPLHSRLPTVDQKLVFERPPDRVRKIIIATSIAETSITIEDVVFVIDSGKMKLNKFDTDNNIETLLPEPVSLANAKQRRGRAGRVQPGKCYHLYTKAREMTMDEYPLPEMLRTRLEQVILQAKILQLGKIKPFLASVIDPPNAKAVELSLQLLITLNALDEDEQLTPLGYHLAKIPLDPRTGKMIILGAIFSCVEPVFSIAASLTYKDAFYCPLGKEAEAQKRKLELGLGQYSDHIALAEALRRFEEAKTRGSPGFFCRQYFLSWNTLKLLTDMKSQFAKYLCEMNFLHSANPNDERANRNSDNLALVKAVVCAGLFPNVAIVKSVRRHGASVVTPQDGKVKLHPSSINEKCQSFPSPYLVYFTKQLSSAIYLHDTTSISPMGLIFAGPNSKIGEQNGKCVMALPGALSFLCEPETAFIVQKLRAKLEWLLGYKITHPGTIKWDSDEGAVLKGMIELVSQGDEEMGLESRMYHVGFANETYSDSD
ncbi:ATP-dependent DNA/RNA helicase DHX36 [Diprion similis]|uniref:ATP-dependent DNA/RNA helicase DHX36 n=1 Tax=Diprion similis TaxID=362088 RepID=UPI001EF804A6|nr:ATP-dependent DNA/RNA helicase DHX36 [Diprion similis]